MAHNGLPRCSHHPNYIVAESSPASKFQIPKWDTSAMAIMAIMAGKEITNLSHRYVLPKWVAHGLGNVLRGFSSLVTFDAGPFWPKLPLHRRLRQNRTGNGSPLKEWFVAWVGWFFPDFLCRTLQHCQILLEYTDWMCHLNQ